MTVFEDDPLLIGVSALANSSRTPIDRSEVLAILSTGDGPGHLVRALFEDCTLESLDRMAIGAGLTSAQVRAAYLIARTRHQARNSEMESEVVPFFISRSVADPGD
jgi:hypothetical protein